jgi:hypothetical protein
LLLALHSIEVFVLATLLASISFAQNNKDTTANISPSTEEDNFNKMIEYSRPGKYHQLLGDLVGSWKFAGSHFECVDSVTNKVAVKLYGTVILPKRWIVQCTFAWLDTNRRNAKDYERLTETSQAMILLSSIRLMLLNS